MSDKAREFWLCLPSHPYNRNGIIYSDNSFGGIHVIEHSAYEAVKAELYRLQNVKYDDIKTELEITRLKAELERLQQERGVTKTSYIKGLLIELEAVRSGQEITQLDLVTRRALVTELQAKLAVAKEALEEIKDANMPVESLKFIATEALKRLEEKE